MPELKKFSKIYVDGINWMQKQEQSSKTYQYDEIDYIFNNRTKPVIKDILLNEKIIKK
jgi:hypothetical protein